MHQHDQQRSLLGGHQKAEQGRHHQRAAETGQPFGGAGDQTDEGEGGAGERHTAREH